MTIDKVAAAVVTGDAFRRPPAFRPLGFRSGHAVSRSRPKVNAAW
jgi:hypothetical protein